MKIWQCKYEKFVNGQLITSSQLFDDSNILLDCICDTYTEMINYMISTCLNWCNTNNAKLVSFEIIAE